LLIVCILWSASATAQEPIKLRSSLYPPEVIQRVRANVARDAWAGKVRESAVRTAQPWLAMSDDQLWELMFGPAITRSWMVWSNGHCPACRQSVPMYTWDIEALDHPWKVRCPHCREWFPKNDFAAFYRSGLNEYGLFDPARADRALLFNAEHPQLDDPLRSFGVDDGEGFQQEGNRWRFIGAYLIYGQWKQAVLGGIRALSAAYVIDGNPQYAHKAGVLLDRAADIYPTFDFKTQGLVYEVPGVSGYVSTWHDTCEETRELALAYDMIFDAIKSDPELPAFLARKAEQHKLENRKQSFADVQRNIDTRILQDALNNRPKIHSNYPRTEICSAILLSVLQQPGHQEAFDNTVSAMLEKATAVDGVTGEKGLAGYSAFTISAVAMFLAEYSKSDPSFVSDMLQRFPRVRDMFRFHIDTHCLDRYYPESGDSGGYALPCETYVGMPFISAGGSVHGFPAWTMAAPSTYTLLWRLTEATGDPAFAQVAYRSNGKKVDGLPYDLFSPDPEAVRKGIAEVVAREGEEIRLPSINKQQWHLALLRSGEGTARRVVWLDYDAGGGHGHFDGLNLGLFAKGLDLMPEFGYPAVQFGGWGSPRGRWYVMTAAHNTVVVNGANQPSGAGTTTLWMEGKQVHAVRASAPALNGGRRYERTAVLVDVAPEQFYVVDVFRVAGGRVHTKFLQSHFGSVATTGLALQPAPDFGHETQTRNFQLDPAPAPGWRADWTIEDRCRLLPENEQVHCRYTDFTVGAQAGLSEAWLVAGGYNRSEEMWIPRVVVQRQAPEGQDLQTTFAGAIEVYDREPILASIERLPLESQADGNVALRLHLPDGRTDVIILRDPELPAKELTVVPGVEIRTDAELCWVRLGPNHVVRNVAFARGTYVIAGSQNVTLPAATEQHEWESP